MLSETEQVVNWIRRRNPDARTWKDYGYACASLPPSPATVHLPALLFAILTASSISKFTRFPAQYFTIMLNIWKDSIYARMSNN